MGRSRQFEFTSLRPPFSALRVRSARVGGDAQLPTGTVRSAASLSYAHPRVIVVSGYKVNARPRVAAPFVKQIGGTSQARRPFSRFSFIALPETSDGVAKAIVPLRPSGRERPHLVPSRSAMPWLRDEFHLAQNRVLSTGIHKSTALVESSDLATKDSCQIEAEATDVHFSYPITQAIGDHLKYAWMGSGSWYCQYPCR